MNPIVDVQLSRKVEKGLKKLPLHVVIQLQAWIDAVGHYGLGEVKKIPGYHDEPLKGDRKGQRSIRLTRSYRAIYVMKKDICCIEVIEVNKHEY